MIDKSLDALAPAASALKVGGVEVSILPLKVKELSAFTKAVAPVFGMLKAGNVDPLIMIAEHAQAVIDAVAIACRQPAAWVEELEAAELVILLAEVLKVNADFFTTVAQMIGRGVVAPSAAPETGLMSPSSSSATATASTPS